MGSSEFSWKLADHPKLPKGKTIAMIVLDGWGEATSDDYNCIHKAGTVTMDSLKFIYNDRTPFEKLPDKYFCPVCGAPKRRFRPYEMAVNKNANSTDVRKERKEQIKKDESLGKVLYFVMPLLMDVK